MDLTIPDQLSDYAQTASAIANDPAAARARYGPEATTEGRTALLGKLEAFGLFDLAVADDPDQLLIAGTVLRALGREATGLPLPALVTGRAAGLEGPLYAVGAPGTSVMIDGVDLGLPAFAIDIDGTGSRMHETGRSDPTRILARFGALAELSDPRPGEVRWWALHEVLTGFLVLGVLERAVDESRRHLNEREQFGRPLKSFQALAHRFSDMIVRKEGVAELCMYTAWAHHHRPRTALADALALRLYALDALVAVARSAHQIHAAIGFCHEHPLADLTASTWLLRVQPLTASQVAEALADRAPEFEMLFSDEPAPATHAGAA